MKKSILLLLAAIFMAASLYAVPPNWVPISGTQYSLVLIASATIDDVEFTGTGENMIAAFGPGGDTDCRGVGSWNGAGFWYFTIVSNDNNQEITFQMYNSSTDEILECTQTVNFIDNDVIGTPTTPFELSSGTVNGTISGTINLINTHSGNIDITNVLISANGITTLPDNMGNYSIVVPAGHYNISASLDNFTSNYVHVYINSGQTIENVDFSLIDWKKINGTQYSLTVNASLEIDNIEIENNPNNFLAAFGPGGYSDCRAIASWEPPNPPYWDGHWFMTVVGNTNGEQITFHYYENEEMLCSETISFADGTEYGSPFSHYPLTIGSTVEQHIDLNSNWNWISFYVEPENSAISSVFMDIEDNAYQIKNQTASATYSPTIGRWVGDLTSIAPGEAYLLKMTQSDQLVISGNEIDQNIPINLAANWNWVSYYPQYNMTVDNALTTILDNVIQVKGQSETASYYNPPGAWVGALEYMAPGNGYKIKMVAPDQLIYSGSRDMTPTVSDIEYPNRDIPEWEVINGTQYSMVLMLQVALNDLPFENAENNLVGIFGPDGETDCRGLGVWQEIGDDDGFWYLTVVGNEITEELTFKIYDATNDQILVNEQILDFEDNATIGSPEEPFSTYFYTTNIDQTEIVPASFQIYPNPFRLNSGINTTTISFSAKTVDSDTTVEIYNVKGQLVNTLTTAENGENNQTVNWNGKDYSNNFVGSGVYLMLLNSSNKTIATQKCMVIK